jgi:hypothetical protein
MDIAMEIDRLKELDAREKAEKGKLAKRVEDRSVIIDQIEARKKLKILQEEGREQENRQMLQTIKKVSAVRLLSCFMRKLGDFLLLMV